MNEKEKFEKDKKAFIKENKERFYVMRKQIEGKTRCDYCNKDVDDSNIKKTITGYLVCDECYTTEELI